MKNIFSKKPDPKETLRQSKREMAHATRGIDKEISSLQLEEKKLVAEIKGTAKTGNEAATKLLARQLIGSRQQIANLQSSRAQMKGIATHTQAMHAQTLVAAGMKGASDAMAAMNKQMNPAKQAKIMMEFPKQSAQMGMTTEMISDAIDDALDNDEAEEETDELTNQTEMISDAIDDALDNYEAEEETDELTNQVLDEIGVDIASQLSTAPKNKIAGKNAEEPGISGVDELAKWMAALRNP